VLEDAGAVRTCAACRGQWILEPVLAEMVVEMLPAGVYGRLTLVPSKHDRGIGACPSCDTKMEPMQMYGVEIERCPKQHGVWFDPKEMEIALRRAADPTWHENAAAALSLSAPPDPKRPMLRFQIQTPGETFRDLRVQQTIIKIGRLASCHVQLSDERTSRMHAVIEVTEDGPVIIDLGSKEGTVVNGTAIVKHTLKSGDRLRLGATSITVTFGETI
jgi:Zn-finger nucleic acid-binding protein